MSCSMVENGRRPSAKAAAKLASDLERLKASCSLKSDGVSRSLPDIPIRDPALDRIEAMLADIQQRLTSLELR